MKRLAPWPAEPWDTEECVHWWGTKNPSGYGLVRADGRVRGAHRYSYEKYVGPIPEGLEVEHRCRVRSCVNPRHLEAVTHRENMSRAGLLALGVCRSGKHKITSKLDLYTYANGSQCKHCVIGRSKLNA